MNLSKIEKSKVSFICMLPKIPKISSGNYGQETTKKLQGDRERENAS